MHADGSPVQIPITSNRFSDSFWDRLEVGSSMMMIRASTESAFGDFDQLLMPDRQVGHKRVGRKIQPNLLQVTARFLVNPFADPAPRTCAVRCREKYSRRYRDYPTGSVPDGSARCHASALLEPNRFGLARPSSSMVPLSGVCTAKFFIIRTFATPFLSHQGQKPHPDSKLRSTLCSARTPGNCFPIAEIFSSGWASGINPFSRPAQPSPVSRPKIHRCFFAVTDL